MLVMRPILGVALGDGDYPAVVLGKDEVHVIGPIIAGTLHSARRRRAGRLGAAAGGLRIGANLRKFILLARRRQLYW